MSYTAHKLRASALRRLVIDDPADATVARYIGPGGAGVFADMGLYGKLLVAAMLHSGTGILTFRIVGATSAAGAGATPIIAHADPTVADAAGDTVFLEITAEQLRALGPDFRYVAAEMDNDLNTDVNVLYFEFADPTFAHLDLTADVIA